MCKRRPARELSSRRTRLRRLSDSTSGAVRRISSCRRTQNSKSSKATVKSAPSSKSTLFSNDGSSATKTLSASGATLSQTKARVGTTSKRIGSASGARLRHDRVAQDGIDAVIGGDAFELGVRLQLQAVTEHGVGVRFYVVGDHEVASFPQG